MRREGHLRPIPLQMVYSTAPRWLIDAGVLVVGASRRGQAGPPDLAKVIEHTNLKLMETNIQ